MPTDGHAEEPTADQLPDAVAAALASVPSVGMTRRDFTAKVGVTSVAAVGLAWASPSIRTIRFAAKAPVGSPPPGSTTTTSIPVGPEGGHISISSSSPCVGDTLRVQADGFAPRTAVTLQLDSAANTLGVATADSTGKIDVSVKLHKGGPTGNHTLMAVGVQTGGRILTLSKAVHIRTESECEIGPEGTTTTIGRTSSSTTPTSTPTPTTRKPGGGGGGKPVDHGTGELAFTGTDAIDLALVGVAATVGGRALFALARPRDEDEEDD